MKRREFIAWTCRRGGVAARRVCAAISDAGDRISKEYDGG